MFATRRAFRFVSLARFKPTSSCKKKKTSNALDNLKFNRTIRVIICCTTHVHVYIKIFNSFNAGSKQRTILLFITIPEGCRQLVWSFLP